MGSRKRQKKMIRLGLIFTMVLSLGLLSACGSGGESVNKPLAGAGAPSELDPLEGKSWDKMTWNKGKWG